MAKRLFLGIDVSTTGAKALLIDEKGGVLASATTPLCLSTPKPLWSEQDPLEWWTGTSASLLWGPSLAIGFEGWRRRP
jgi:xylulokinase